MLTFTEFLDSDEINEMAARRSLSRIMHHMDTHEIGVLSAFRGNKERTPAENNDHTAELEHSIRSSGFSHFPVNGRYTEDHDGKSVPVKEKSFVVINHDNKPGFKDFLTSHGEKHGQDSIIHKPLGSSEAFNHMTNDTSYAKKGDITNLGTFHPNRIPEYHTVLTRGMDKPKKPGQTAPAHKTFAFDPKSPKTTGDSKFQQIR